jgi:hypothetical protein
MARGLIRHAHRHVIAYLALACALLALGGAAYAQFRLPRDSVGEVNIKNHVIDPVKWDTIYVTGFIRRWATISAAGSLLSTSPGGQSESVGTGSYVVTWGDGFAGWCAPIATVIGGSGARSITGPGAYADARVVTRTGLSTMVAIATFNSAGKPTDEPVSIAVACGPGAGGGQTFLTNLP